MSAICRERILEYHRGGKIGVRPTRALRGQEDLCLAYTPGVAVPVKAIAAKPAAVHRYTAKDNLVAVVTDGTAILGLGDLGATASIPVMEGKAVLFKAFADVDGWPVPLEHCRLNGACAGKTDPERVIDTVARLACMFGGINLEDIAAPACFEIESRLDKRLDIPVFHDDQWGTAVITLAGMLNYSEISGRPLGQLRVVVNGAGAAGIRIADMLKNAGVRDLVLCDSKGVIREDRTDLHDLKRRHAVRTRLKTLDEVLRGAHAFIGVSAANCLAPDAVKAMAGFPAVFAMANPDPEIRPEIVKRLMGRRPYVMATGRSDTPNQINNVLGFPFLFRGALDSGARTINMAMKIAAAHALAGLARKPAPASLKRLYPGETLVFGPAYLVPKPFDRRLLAEVSSAVAEAAAESGAAPRRLKGYREQLVARLKGMKK
ncbi:MAG: malate dehydrogenase [Lentisphaerae bacterium]|nr:malate dehydrogenase [Lentisphaerota bacterium]